MGRKSAGKTGLEARHMVSITEALPTTAFGRWIDSPISVVDLFTIGIGPSSSHTVGPMRAANCFVEALGPDLHNVTEITVELYGSLALTGIGHGTDIAILLGLSGWQPETVDPDRVLILVNQVRNAGTLMVGGKRVIPFNEKDNLLFRMGEFLSGHPNAVRFSASTVHRRVSQIYYSVGGGAVVQEGQKLCSPRQGDNLRAPFPFSSAAELLSIGSRTGQSIAEIMLANEQVWREQHETFAFLDKVRDAMMASIDRGCRQDGILPGGLNVRRRARKLYEGLLNSDNDDPMRGMDWVNVYALAVNEENAAGGRVVTAPTNGAAGVIPAVLKYYETFCSGSLAGARNFLLTSAAIGILFKKRASISAAEMGCQGEVGVACSMAAGALAAVLGGTIEQIENAAEIGMEHNLGLTCDPIKGLVQVPCIERNTMGAIKAINAARLALRGDGKHLVSLDAVIETMRQTGEDMRSKYKETSLGGLAVNVVEC
jgi:L-serine dehydratase